MDFQIPSPFRIIALGCKLNTIPKRNPTPVDNVVQYSIKATDENAVGIDIYVKTLNIDPATDYLFIRPGKMNQL